MSLSLRLNTIARRFAPCGRAIEAFLKDSSVMTGGLPNFYAQNVSLGAIEHKGARTGC